jgi:uncharacterized protein YbjT (DUF2867 family)
VKTALLFGSSGLVGNQLLKKLIDNKNYNLIKIFVRSEIFVNHPKVQLIKTDFYNIENYKEVIKGNDCFFCIGTTKKNSPKKDEYQYVELELPKKIAQIAKSNSVNSFIFVSSGFANSKNAGEYLRYKGLVEEKLQDLQFSKLGILRPSFLLGDRKVLRVGEKIGIFFFKLITPILIGPLTKMKPIAADTVAEAMIKIANQNLDKIIFESNEIQNINKF